MVGGVVVTRDWRKHLHYSAPAQASTSQAHGEKWDEASTPCDEDASAMTASTENAVEEVIDIEI